MTALFLLVSPVPPQLSAAPTSSPSPEIVLSSTYSEKDQASAFSCSGRIYALFTPPPNGGKDVKMESFWHRPGGGLQARAEVTVPGGKPAHLWLQFKDTSRTLLDEFKWTRSESPFHGTWVLEIRKDGAPWARREFTVACMQE